MTVITELIFDHEKLAVHRLANECLAGPLGIAQALAGVNRHVWGNGRREAPTGHPPQRRLRPHLDPSSAQLADTLAR
jgi:hypothetical protein